MLAQLLRGPLWPSLLLPTPLPWPLCALPHAAWAAALAYKSSLSLETSDPNQMAVQCQQSKLSFQQCLTRGLGAPLGSCPVNHYQLATQALAAAGDHDLSEMLRDCLGDIPLGHIKIS